MNPVHDLLAQAIEKGAFPGATYAFGTPDNVVTGAVGTLEYGSGTPVTAETLYDLASLTKVLATTTAAMKVFSPSKGELERTVRSFLPGFQSGDITLAHLLRHDSGLPAYDFELAGTLLNEQAASHRLLTANPVSPPGTETVYSCINFVTLKACLDVAAPNLVETHVWDDWNMTFLPTKREVFAQTCVAPTETLEPWRNRIPQWLRNPSLSNRFTQGVVHDPVAYYQGGISGNAGLFGSIEAIARYAQTWVTDPEQFSNEWQTWTTKQSPNSTRALGWDTKSAENSSCGTFFGPRSFGHLGFTGTSLWIDPDAKLFAVLLTNRVHPTADNLQIQEVRPKFHDTVFHTVYPPAVNLPG